MKKPCIGILAGMGPRSTAPFVDMVVDECAKQYGAVYDIDFPAMLIYSLPAPFFPDRPVDHEALRDAIMSGLKELAGFGADFIAMPCNIAHMYYDELKASIKVPLLNIIEETVARLPRHSRCAACRAGGCGIGALPERYSRRRLVRLYARPGQHRHFHTICKEKRPQS